MRGVTSHPDFNKWSMRFQPALPMRGVTASMNFIISEHFAISTRTPHAGSDFVSYNTAFYGLYFNPHSPCGE